MNMLKFAEHILEVAKEENIGVSYTKLQYVMYFTLKFAMERNIVTKKVIENFYDEPFVVTPYGPKIKPLDHWWIFRRFGSSIIIGSSINKYEEFDIFNSIIIEILQINIIKLIKSSIDTPFFKRNEHLTSMDNFYST